MAEYIALIRKDEETDYCVDFPDFPGCVTTGETLEEARQMAAEALALHADGMLEEGEPIPEPSSLDAAMRDPENREAVVVLVELNSGKKRVVRVNVTFVQDVLEQIDEYASAHDTTRSALLAEAALRHIRSVPRKRSQKAPKPRRAKRKRA
jgi:predicted RNase H-like HicB family nuclease